MANGLWVGSVNDSISRMAVRDVRVTVTDPVTGDLLGLYVDRDGTKPLGNPFLTRESGEIKFYARPGRVNISAFKSGVEQIFENEIILDDWPPASSDDYIITVGYTDIESEVPAWGYGQIIDGFDTPQPVTGGAISNAMLNGVDIWAVVVRTFYLDPTPQGFAVYLPGNLSRSFFISVTAENIGTLATSVATHSYNSANDVTIWEWVPTPTGTWGPVGGTKTIIFA